MSQFTGFSSGQRRTLLDPARRDGTRGSDARVGMPQNVNAVNLPTAPVVPNTLASQFIATMRSVTGGATAVGQVATDIQEARNRQEANEILLQAQTALPEVYTAIDEGRLSGRSAEDITNTLLAGASNESVASFVRGRIQPQVAGRIEQADRAAANELRARGINTANRAVQTATTADEVRESLAGLGDFARSDAEREALERGALLQGLETAALAGDGDQFEVFNSLLPDGVATVDRQRLSNQLQSRQAAIARERESVATEQVFGALNAAVAGEGTFAAAEQVIQNNRDTLSESTIRSLRNTIRSEQERVGRAIDTQAWLGNIRDTYVAPSLNGPTNTRLGDLAGTTVDGVEVPQEVVDGLVDEAAATILQQRGVTRLGEWMIDQGVDAIPFLKKTMDVALMGINLDAQTVSDEVVSSFSTWREMAADSRDIANAHVSGELQATYRLANVLLDHGAEGDRNDGQAVKRALLMARTAMQKDVDRGPISEKAIRQETPGRFKDLRNRDELDAIARGIAHAFSGNSMNEDLASKAAWDYIEDDYVVSGQFASRKGNLDAGVVKAIEDGTLPKAVVATFVNDNPTYRSGDLTIRRGVTSGVWQVVDRKTGFPVPGSLAFTEDELAEQLKDANYKAFASSRRGGSSYTPEEIRYSARGMFGDDLPTGGRSLEDQLRSAGLRRQRDLANILKPDAATVARLGSGLAKAVAATRPPQRGQGFRPILNAEDLEQQ